MTDRNKLSTEPYKGVRDFYPRDMFLQNYIFDTMREVAERYGYLEYSASVLEPAELYEAKSGEELVNEQTYTFEDRGGRRVTLRPEMTPSVTRMVAGKRRELGFPLRLYSIGNMLRYERPQRGRLREHWQLNCDIFGVSGMEADTEIILLASQIMKAYGAEEEDFEVRVSDRKLLKDAFKEIGGVSESTEKAVTQLLDKREKIDNFDEEMVRHLNADKKERFLELLENTEATKELENVKGILSEIGVSNIVIDTKITRGFDYYTGTVFEVFDTSPENNRSLFGGGRYDNLLDLFGGEAMPAVGFGMGDITVRDFLETHNLLPAYTPTIDLYVCVLGTEHVGSAHKLAESLRTQGLNVAVDFSGRKVGDQIKTADRQSVRFVTLVGSDEVASKRYRVKNLTSGEERGVDENEIGNFVWSQEM